MREFKNFMEFRLNMNLIPERVALDVMTRITDWIISEGCIDDEYVKQNLKFASEFIEN